MKKLLIFVCCAVFFINFHQANAQTPEEAITNFDTTITVNLDNSVDVAENITYITGPSAHHGIYRDISPYSSMGQKMDIEDITVTDPTGQSYPFQLSTVDKNLRIKIGDPNQTFTGQKTYLISYHATRATAQLKDIDEIYWNVTGNEWQMPIYKAAAHIVLPNSIESSQQACYYGPRGSTLQCAAFTAPRTLAPGEGLTVAAGFAKGALIPYSTADTAASFWAQYGIWFVAGLFPLVTLIFSLLYWYRYGRDPKGKGIIVPQYDAPNGLTPLEVAAIVEEKVKTEHISAELIYLATKGYIKIRQVEKKILGLINATDYEITKLKGIDEGLTKEADQQLMRGLFAGRPNIIMLSDLQNIFYKEVPPIITSVLTALVENDYYKNLGAMKPGRGTASGIAVFLVWIFLINNHVDSWSDAMIPFIVAFILSLIIFFIIYRFSPAKTERGVATKEYILGLKEYLQIAEKDRLAFHNAPEKRPEIFEKLLPYAMVLGVSTAWAKEFQDIYTTPPSWYVSAHPGVFDAMVFNNSLSNFRTMAATSLTASPHSGGSGGGGFSGGGGGGGGGGSW